MADLMERMMSNMGSGCEKPVGRGYITFPCRLDRDHDGPCVAPENPASMRARQEWEDEQARVQADIASAETARRVEESAYGPAAAKAQKAQHQVENAWKPPEEHLAATRGMGVPTKQRPGDQRLPSGGGSCVQDKIIETMIESKRVGQERYGQVLRTFNGRRTMVDVYDEVRDLHVYLTQVMMEGEADRQELVSVVLDSMRDSDHQGHTWQQSAEQIVDRLGGWLTANRMGGQE